MTNNEIDKKNESFKKQSEDAERSKSSSNTNDKTDKRLHQPNRPST